MPRQTPTAEELGRDLDAVVEAAITRGDPQLVMLASIVRDLVERSERNPVQLAAAVRPGDRLILGVPRDLSRHDLQQLRDRVVEHLTDVEVILITGVTAMSVQQPQPISHDELVAAGGRYELAINTARRQAGRRLLP